MDADRLLSLARCFAQTRATTECASATEAYRPTGAHHRPVRRRGPGDMIARLIAQQLSEGMGKQFYVENSSGDGGNIGMGMSRSRGADGYTIMDRKLHVS